MSNLTDQLRDVAGQMAPGQECRELMMAAAVEIERLNREGIPGQMHAVDRAFYDLTVLQRDSAWRELEAIRDMTETLRGRVRGQVTP